MKETSSPGSPALWAGSFTLPIFHESFLLTPGFFPENEEISAPPPCGFLIGIYLSYENRSTGTFRKKELRKWDVCYIKNRRLRIGSEHNGRQASAAPGFRRRAPCLCSPIIFLCGSPDQPSSITFTSGPALHTRYRTSTPSGAYTTMGKRLL